MNHHDRRRQELNTPNKVRKRIIPQRKQKRTQSKSNALYQQYLQRREQPIQQRRANVHRPPAPLDEELFVRHNAQPQQHVRHDQQRVQLIGGEVQDGL